ncbi:MAG: class I SAM-dependent methyltransferase [Anaerolineales bacterium]|nr:MAG: class I SAM-dependent methyltransferase [Anaerolineales bacterium]
MLNSKITYDAEHLRKLYNRSQETLLEMAAPSYLHPNPLIRWIVGRRMREAISFLNLEEGASLLDFGCGAGILFLQLPNDGRSYIGVDLELWPAEGMLAHHGRTDVKLYDSQTWVSQVADRSLDNITALEVLEHVSDLPALLTTFRQKLGHEGRLVVSGPTENKIYKLARKVSGFSGDYHVRDIFEIRKAIEAAGFVLEQRSQLPLPGPLCLFSVERYRLAE